MIHVKVYTLATKYLIEPLRKACLGYLHHELKKVQPGPSAPLLVWILDYVYDNTTPYEPEGMSPLRNLIMQFMAIHNR